MKYKNPVILICLIIVCASMGLFLVFRHNSTLQTLTITPQGGSQIALYDLVKKEEGFSYDKNKPVLMATSQTTQKIKKGTYVYVAKSTDRDYETEVQPIDLKDVPVILAPRLDYTDAKLGQLLRIEEPLIVEKLIATYPSAMTEYSVQHGKLYKAGQWYGASLVPNDSSKYDTLRIVLKKEKGMWGVVTKPPEIIISKPVYPEIPGDILTDLNNFH